MPAPARANPLESLFGYQLRRASSAMQADLNQRLAEVGVTTVEMSIVLVVEANPKITQSEIGRMLAIKSANMAPLAAGLCARGLIERLPVDGRSQGLNLTAAGQAMTGDLRRCIEANEAFTLSHFTNDQKAQAKTLMRLIWSGKK